MSAQKRGSNKKSKKEDPKQLVIWTELSGDNEVPPVISTASGRAALTVDTYGLSVVLHVLTIDLEEATASHIHLGFAGENGDIILGLEQDVDDMNHWILSNTVLEEDINAALWNDELYVNVHTTPNPGGELRGQLEP